MSEVYRIGVNIAMASNGSALLGVLGRDLLGIHSKVGDLEKGFSRLKLAIGGAVAIAGGLAIIASFKAPLDEARKFEVAVTKFSGFGLGTKRTQEAADFAKQMDITGSSYVENMTRMIEAQGVFRESGLSGEAALRGAKIAAPLLAKIDFANSALDGESQARMHGQALDMMRFIEMRGGVNSPERFNAIADQGYKAIMSSGGNVQWGLYRQFMSTGGVAAQGLSDKALFGQFEPVIGEMKSRAGTALMTAFNRLTGITRVPNQVAHELVNNGLWDGSRIDWNSQGGIKRMKGNPLRDMQTFSDSPIDWYQKNILPMYAKMKLSPADMNREDALIGGRTGGLMFSLFRRQQGAISNSVEAQRKTLGIDQMYGAAGGTLNGKIIDMQKKWANLLERLGEAVLPLAVKGLNALIPAIAAVTHWMAANPGKLQMFAKAAVLVGGALIGFGVVAIGVAAFAALAAGGEVALLVAGFGAIVGAVSTFVVLNWGAITGAFDKLKSVIGGFLNWLIHGDGQIKPGGYAQAFGNSMNGRSAVPPAANSNLHVHTAINLDGKKLAQAVTQHQVKGAGGPANGPAGFDASRSYTPVFMGVG